MKRQPEFDLQKRVCSYLRAVHPDLFFMSDTIASVKLTKFQAKRNSQIQKPGFKTPDLLIFYPKGDYHGLFIELKIESPYKLNGELKSNKHIQEQSETISKLKGLGYHASFQWNFNDIVKLINWYLTLQ
ncbi:hypothetical protein [Chryseobacterium aquifrigidense]|uniref:VRR-NUC domain-containing protein n=1 Tax=Chryseobacterium aquifrigidense TaxID=558021 RepID=A0A543E9P5_9FLAO|nr:hypothetical protein [Chryseobacterium aquifrigidense]TQM18321.1 hypothetical protein FB551_4102 [Chryseobacterium aquifrigidense]